MMEGDRRKIAVCSNRAELWFIPTHLLPSILFLIPILYLTDEEQCRSPTLPPILDIAQSGIAEFRSTATPKISVMETQPNQTKLSTRVQWVPPLHKQWQTQAPAFVLFHFISFSPILLSPTFLIQLKSLFWSRTQSCIKILSLQLLYINCHAIEACSSQFKLKSRKCAVWHLVVRRNHLNTTLKRI